MTSPSPWFETVELAGHHFQALDVDHAHVVARVTDEMRAGMEVYYDRRWRLTRALCRYLLRNPGRVANRAVLVAGAGVGLEAVVIGTLARRVVVNDLAPVALELAAEQLRANRIRDAELREGSFATVGLQGTELVVGCLVVYDAATRDATLDLLERSAAAGIPTLLANADIGSFFTEVLARAPGPMTELWSGKAGRIVQLG